MAQRDLQNKVTVVIPNYNGIAYLRDCLSSLFGGTALPRVIVVDNHSTDGSAELVEKEFPKVLLHRIRANTGFCHAVNCGLHLVQTKYAILLNNDTKVDPAFVEKLVEAISQSGRLFSVQAKMLMLSDPSRIDDAGDCYSALGWAFARGKGQPAEKFDRPGQIFAACAGAAIYRMSVFDEIGWFDERHYCYLEDVDIGYRAKIYGYQNGYAPKAIVYHAGSAATGSRHNAFKETMTAGNAAYLRWKNQPALWYGLNALPAGIGTLIKRRYFRNKNLGEAYDRGITRGRVLIDEAKDQALFQDAIGYYRKGSIPDEACIEGNEDALREILPLYLGGKVPFTLRHLHNYLKIQGELIGGTFQRLFN
ncbi:MAG: glycosyltransferase family 2 protein [Firmicutes bacterium]|jgi:GT2 family glycosyltransferase|nr:glycosyltransferase family 2 protein [Bacillota bacterium]